MTEFSDKDALRTILAVIPDAATVLSGPAAFDMTGAELRRTINSHWDRLERSVPQGARIATLLPDAPQTAVALLALSHHARVMPINPALTDTEIRAILTDAQADAVIIPAMSEMPDAPCPVGHIEEDGILTLPDLDAPDDGTPGLILMTSGSTGLPKRVPITCSQLRSSADRIARALDLSPNDRAVHALPMFHIGAIVDLLLAPLIAGGTVRFAGGMGSAPLRDAVLEGGGTWLQLVPTMLNRLRVDLSAEEADAMGAHLRFIRSVSADLAPDIHARTEALFGGTPIIQMYGMTETAGQITTNRLPPLIRKPGTVGQPFEVALRIAEDNEVQVRGDAVMAGYEGLPDDDHFTEDGWLRTGDLGQLDEDGFLTLTGRAKEMINRGGEKISPHEIEHAALACRIVADAAAFAIPHPSLGDDVGLAVTLVPDSDAAELKAHLTSSLATFKCPRNPLVLETLPRLGSGKIDRKALAAMSLSDTKTTEAQHEGIDAQIAQAWRAVLPDTAPDGPDPSQDFFDAGGDSLAGAQFVFEVERLTGRSVPPNQLFETPVFADFARAVADAPRRDAPGGDPKIAFLRDRLKTWDADPVPGIDVFRTLDGGNGSPLFWCVQEEDEYHHLAQAVTPARAIYLMRSLFLMLGKNDQMNRLLAQEYAAHINGLVPEGPILLGGFCEGAKIMRFAAETLMEMGRDVALLISWDQWFEDPLPVPTLHFWSDDRFDKYRRAFLEPEKVIAAAHPAGYQIIRLPGGHSEVLTKGPFEPFTPRLNRALADGLEAARAPSTFSRTLRGAGTLRVKRLLPKEQTITATLTLRNGGDEDWSAAPDKPLIVIAEFQNLDGYKHPALSGAVQLIASVQAGSKINIDLPITVPKDVLPMWLKIDLVDDLGQRASAADIAMPKKLVWAIG